MASWDEFVVGKTDDSETLLLTNIPIIALSTLLDTFLTGVSD